MKKGPPQNTKVLRRSPCTKCDYWQGGVSCISGTLSGVSGTISDLNNHITVYAYTYWIYLISMKAVIISTTSATNSEGAFSV